MLLADEAGAILADYDPDIPGPTVVIGRYSDAGAAARGGSPDGYDAHFFSTSPLGG